MNKPCLSITEILSLQNNILLKQDNKYFMKEPIKLVKSKL